MKTLFEYTIAALCILTLLLGLAELVLESFVIAKVSQEYGHPTDSNQRADCLKLDFSNEICFWLDVISIGPKHLIKEPNNMGIVAGLFAIMAGGFTFVYVMLRQTWRWGYFSCVACVVSFLLGLGTLIYAFVDEHRIPDKLEFTRETLLCDMRTLLGDRDKFHWLNNACGCARAGRWILVPNLVLLAVLAIAARIHFRRVPLPPHPGQVHNKPAMTHQAEEE